MREARRQARMARRAIVNEFIDGEVDLSTEQEELDLYEEPSRKARQKARLIRRAKLENSLDERINGVSDTIMPNEKITKKVEKKNKGKRSPLLISAILLIVFGMIVLLYPIVGNILANLERSEARTSYDTTMKKMSQEKKGEAWELAEEYNNYIFSKQEGTTTSEVEYKKVLDLGDTKNNVMGTIDIPAIDIVQLPFYHGTDMKTLDKGLGHFQPSSVPVGGVNTRSVITGHSGVKNQVLFTDIRNLKEGDLFFINVLGKRLAYEIDSFEEILPSEVEKVKITPGRDVVTLLTCTPPGINTYRLIVNGHRIPYAKAEKMPINKRNFWSYQSIVLSSLLFCFVVFMILYLLHRYFMKKSK
ncbi:sortase A, partial [Pilibacter termitis]